MRTFLSLAGLIFCLDAERPIRPSRIFSPFYADPQKADIAVHYHWDWLNARHPHTLPAGSDLLQVYYREPDYCYCEYSGEGWNAVSCTCYKKDFSEISCAVNEVTCKVPQDTEAQLLQMLPMREIFLHFGILFFHASQISFGGRGILFTAPSGTGKTTQAKLWCKHRGAELICSDRTLTRKINGMWRTYGYPLDGSEPVRSSAINPLGAVVLLEQGAENKVERLGPSKALPLLMRQMVMDCWSAEARSATMDLLINLMEDIPVYRLFCTPDERALEALEHKLIEDEVISNG